MNLLDLSKLLFPTRGGLLLKGLVFLIDRMPCKLLGILQFVFGRTDPAQKFAHRAATDQVVSTESTRHRVSESIRINCAVAAELPV